MGRPVDLWIYTARHWTIVYAISDRHPADFARFAKEISEKFLDANQR